MVISAFFMHENFVPVVTLKRKTVNTICGRTVMLIDCPSCKKKISDKAKACQHCDFTVGANDADALLRKKKMERYAKHQSLQTQSFVAMLLFLTGFGMMYWGEPEIGSNQHSLAMLICVVGFAWYIINRARLVMIKGFNFKFWKI